MSDLANKVCIVCRKNALPLGKDESKSLLLEIPDWSLVEEEGIPSLQRQFTFMNFSDALNFANRVGEAAELADHHPSILIEWGQATVTWWTHSVKGLHLNDFIMAAKTDLLSEQ
jgi:4a-hydroxytetrahydrobiopterin dehydratase